MKSTERINDNFISNKIPISNLNRFVKKERIVLKLLVLFFLHQSVYELCDEENQVIQDQISLEWYLMDEKIIRFVIKQIIETGEYTLEGIAYYTHIPFDIIYEAACGINKHISITTWTKIIDLYLQVKPDVKKVFIKKLLDLNEKDCATVSLLLKEV